MTGPAHLELPPRANDPTGNGATVRAFFALVPDESVRMALVDLNIMRLATCELKFAPEPVPPAVVINEAIEISKKYGTVDSAAFVNGILDQIMKH